MGLLGAFVELLFDIADDIARFGNWLRKNPIAGLGAMFLVVFFSWLTDRLLADSVIFTAAFWESSPEGIRNLVWAMATVFAGAAGLYGLYLAGRRTAALDRQAQVAHDHRLLAEQGQITERFTKAVEHLGHPSIAVRLGAIYALERIARDSDDDKPSVLDTLAAFVRQHAPWPRRHEWQEKSTTSPERNILSSMVDISAAITVLTRNALTHARDGKRLNSGQDLRQVDLRFFDFRYTNFSGLFLHASNLSGAGFREAKFVGTELEASSFEASYCFSTDFSGANLTDTSFVGCTLSAAMFRGADVSGADFSQADGMTAMQLSEARYQWGYPPKNLPAGVMAPVHAYGNSEV